MTACTAAAVPSLGPRSAWRPVSDVPTAKTLVGLTLRVPPHIRSLRREDLPAVGAALPVAPYRTHADDLESHRAGVVTALVAWQDAMPLGAGFIHWWGPRNALIASLLPGCPEIFRLEVLPEHRSKGVGAALVQHLEALASARGLASVGLGVGLANPRARALYERLGYRPAATPPYVDRCLQPGPDGCPVLFEEPCLLMAKALAAGIPGSLAEAMPAA